MIKNSSHLLDAHISVERGDLTLEVALQVECGETVAIMGPNGAGKTTLLYSLLGWLPLRSGWIILDGYTLDAPGEEDPVPTHLRNFGMVFDDGLLFPHMTVQKNLTFSSGTNGTNSALIELLSLSALMPRRVNQLSAGQRQRVALARTLISKPKMVLLDEPLSSLDASSRIHARDLLKSAFDSEVAGALIVTHDPADAFTLADRVMVLENGKVSQFDTLTALSTQPSTPWIASLIGWNFFTGSGLENTVILANKTEIATTQSGLSGEVTVAINPASVSLFLEAPLGSPRNNWQCEISDIQFVGDVARITLTGALRIHADITKAAAADLSLQKGRKVWVSVKATEVLVQGSEPRV